jgi:tRNA nucleotidyltransferase/poly(A) polymerase
MSRHEKYARTGARPQVTPTSIQEDLRGRDFSINAIALSLNRASMGLLLDPTNGLADLHNRELRALSNYAFYNDPGRMLRLVRFRARFGFTVNERTQQQFENAKLAEAHRMVTPRALLQELHDISNEPSPSEVLRALEQEGLLAVFSPALAGPKLNLAGLARMEKASHLLDGVLQADRFAPFLYVLTEKLTPKEKAALAATLEMGPADTEAWHKIDARARKLEQALKSEQIRKPSHVYQALAKARPEEILFLLYQSTHRTVHDRVKNYLQKYLPAALEVREEDLKGIEGAPGTPKHEKSRAAAIAAHLDRRPKKEEPPPPPPPLPPPRGRGRAL